MTGKKTSSTILNDTLSCVVKLFNDNNVDKWFICYGTLLGLIRENSCIDGDDDIDIITDKNNYDKIKQILTDNNFTLTYGYKIGKSRNILKTKETKKFCTMDIYMADFNDTNVYDLWNRLTISDCYLDNSQQNFIKYIWNEDTLFLPNNSERILTNRYGKWQVKNTKKFPPRKRIL
jgi:hypothetical protein